MPLSSPQPVHWIDSVLITKCAALAKAPTQRVPGFIVNTQQKTDEQLGAANGLSVFEQNDSPPFKADEYVRFNGGP